MVVFFVQAEDGIRDYKVTGVQTCALPISLLGGMLVLWCPVMLLSARLPRLARGGQVADGAVGLAGGVMGGLGGFTGTLPTLWCTLRGYPKDEQRSVIQNFNL